MREILKNLGDEDGLRWKRRLTVGLATASRFGAAMILGTSMAIFIGKIGTPFAVSMISTAYFIGVIFFAPVWGALADITGKRKLILIVTGLLTAAALVPLLFVRGVWLPISIRGLYGVFAGGFAPLVLTIVSDHGGKGGRGKEIGFFNSTRAVGFTLGRLFAGLLLGIFTPSRLYTLVIFLTLISTALSALIEDPRQEREGEGKRVALSPMLKEIGRRLFPARGEMEHLKPGGLNWLLIALSLRTMTIIGAFSLIPVYLTSIVGFSEFTMGVVMSVNSILQVGFMYFFGRLVDNSPRKPLIIFGMLGSGIFSLLLALITWPGSFPLQLALASFSFIMVALAYSSMATGVIAFIEDVAPPGRRSELQGLRSTAIGLGGVFGPILLGAIATLASYQTAFALTAGLSFVAAGMAHFLCREPELAAGRGVRPAEVEEKGEG